MDTTKFNSNNNNISVQLFKDSVSVKKIDNSDCLFIKDILIAYAWPLIILMIFFFLRKNLISLVSSLSDLVKRTIEFKYKDISVKTGKTDYDKSELPENPEKVSDLSPKELLNDVMIKKILSTLWRYQKEKNSSERWTFTLSVYNPEYERFVSSIKKLTKLGIVAQSKESQQFFLTDYGIFYCKENETELSQDIFTF